MATPGREEGGEDLALIVAGRPKRKPPGGPGDMGAGPGMAEEMGAMGMGGEGEEPLPPGFEAAASEAFPEMDPASYPALKRLIASCMESY